MDADEREAVAEQLAQTLEKNAGRVIDLFREWDTNNDGVVSKKEFRLRMPLLGLDASKEAIDDLFDKFDPDGSGEIKYAELRRLLSKRSDCDHTRSWHTSTRATPHPPSQPHHRVRAN